MPRYDTPLIGPGDRPGSLNAAEHAAVYDVARITALLSDSARRGRAISYSEALGLLGLRFSRPKMRALCATLLTIDARCIAGGTPPLAVLVVRESDGLPGQGWWVDRADHGGAWVGPAARAYVDRHQGAAFAYWQSRPG